MGSRLLERDVSLKSSRVPVITEDAVVHNCEECKNARVQETNLRARKKAQTWQEIHVAAADAVLADGLQAVTVEKIAASAGISPRTFFNYFPTKDHAVMGLQDPEIPDGVAERLPEGDSTLRRVVEVYMRVIGSAMPSTSVDLRIRLMKAHPELSRLLKDTMHHAEDTVRGVLQSWVDNGLDVPGLAAGEDLPDRIRMLSLAAGSVLRFALTHPDRVPGSTPTPEDLDRAVALLDSSIRTEAA